LTQIGKVLGGEVRLRDALATLSGPEHRRRHLSLTMETLDDIEQAAAGGDPD
jgi:hypothetical protein